jgi:hypothetical protein
MSLIYTSSSSSSGGGGGGSGRRHGVYLGVSLSLCFL